MISAIEINNNPTQFSSAKLNSSSHSAMLLLHLQEPAPAGATVTMTMDGVRVFTGYIVQYGESAHDTQAIACNSANKLFSMFLKSASHSTIKTKDAIAQVIAQLGIDAASIDLPDLTLPHFSWPEATLGSACINNILAAVQAENPAHNYRYFTDARGIFRVGSTTAASAQEVASIALIDQSQIMHHIPAASLIRTLPLPLLTHQQLTLIDTPITITNSTIFISPKNSYTEVLYERS